MWFPIVILGVLLAGIVVLWWKGSKIPKGQEGSFGFCFLVLVLWVMLIAFLITWPLVYTSSISTVAQLKAFFEANKSAYEYTIKATQGIEIKSVSGAKATLDLGKLVYLKLGPTVSERIKELREKVVWYNQTLEKYWRLNRFWFTDGFVAEVPEGLKLIVLE